ncbi:MAG: valine--tRNA ligase [Candidatus Aenigmarchaeota archaeon]|nr:valine--tRNA ligase [Candidatus Aenigmarchaeota archaeon]
MERYDPKEAEARWQKAWEKEGVYRFDKSSTKPVFSIDTPPPTVSGAMHIGHAFSYSQMDFIARYKRMRGFNVFLPFGTDDNGLATEKLVEKTNNVKSRRMERWKFIELCLATLDKIRPSFVEDWKRIGLSADWSLFYSTIDRHCRRISQRSFIELYEKGLEYRTKAPFMWCPECQTAIAQVELKDAERESNLVHLRFPVGKDSIVIATTRPEMLPACVAVYVHPNDKRYAKLVGKKAELPIIGREVPILANDEVDMAFGTGAVYHCTYGDMKDAEWAKKFKTGVIELLNANGTLNENAGKYGGLKTKDARAKIMEDLEPFTVKIEPIKHVVNTHERCDTDVEILSTYQWFIKYPAKQEMLAAGAKFAWHPEHMKNRYDNWAEGLKWDWCISRQRYFGIPFPVWYCKKCNEVILADKAVLPVDPLKDTPKKCKCGSAEFEGERDVMDTWATSSLTPQITTELLGKNGEKMLPMSLRPQAHDIISFWLFNTVIKSLYHRKDVPWQRVMISGWALDPRGNKMSKSKGNVIAPQEMIKKYSADALRFWAATSNLGEDLAFQEKELVTGTKTINKLWNAANFVVSMAPQREKEPKELHIADKWVLTKLSRAVARVTEALESYDYARAKSETDAFFWRVFTDNYIEVVKSRLYDKDAYSEEERASAKFALGKCIDAALKLYAPIMPHATEEIYRNVLGNPVSIHASAWPDENYSYVSEEKSMDKAVEIIAHVRKYKSEHKMAMNATLKRISVNDALLKGVLGVIGATMNAKAVLDEDQIKDVIIEQ